MIWPDAAGTCWDESKAATRNPIAILEWKGRTAATFEGDVEWLRTFSVAVPDFSGYAVSLNPAGPQTALAAARVFNGEVDAGWLRVPLQATGRSESRGREPDKPVQQLLPHESPL